MPAYPAAPGTVVMVNNRDALMTPTNLASRYRPNGFSTLTGQRHVAAVLRRAIVDGTVPQQLLFSGGSGLGKTTVARIVAAAVLCHTEMTERDQGDPCGSCASCVAMRNDTHPDYVEFDAASHGGKDEIREIAARAQTSPLLSHRRVYVIDEAHGLSAAGGQAFLKLLEEPPGHVLFMLCTTDPERMLRTNRGRCTELELRRPSRGELLANLRRVCSSEGWSVDDQVLETVVDNSDPELGVRGTVNTLQKISPLFSSGAVEPAQVATVLGLAPQALITALLDAISGNGSAHDALVAARNESSDDAIRTALIRWLRSELASPLRLTDPGEVADLLELLLRSPAEPAWLDLFVVRARALATGGRTCGALNQQPQATPKDSARSEPARRGNGTEPGTVNVPGSPAEPDGHGRHTPPQPVAQAGAETGEPAGGGRQEEAFIAAVGRADAGLAEILKECRIVIAEQVEITVPPNHREAVETGMRVLRLAAGRAGLAVVLR
jgi:DNA polymerase-3 subunit gamma/tau